MRATRIAVMNGRSPEEISAEFAHHALGWTDVETISDPEASADGPVWVTIQHPSNEDLEVLTIPVDGDRRALVQVGSSVITIGPNEVGAGQWIGVPPVAAAHSAFLHLRFVDPDRVEVVEADRDALDRGHVEVAAEAPIGGIVIVCLDETGQALTAAGAHYGPPDVQPDASEDVIYTTYVGAEGSVWIESDCPNTDQALKGNPDGLPHISSTTDRAAIEAWFGNPPDSRIIPRNGEVWDRTPDGQIVVTQVEDYMIEVTIDDPGKCPGMPSSTNGVPVIYRIVTD